MQEWNWNSVLHSSQELTQNGFNTRPENAKLQEGNLGQNFIDIEYQIKTLLHSQRNDQQTDSLWSGRIYLHPSIWWGVNIKKKQQGAHTDQ